ncbi:MAG TPA: MBL fold metallo-hydrolase [Solirubrobacteraceae bacterium]|nr:MBL fold metallo-hydrolase [Solirubrobacteraceae bacterium]
MKAPPAVTVAQLTERVQRTAHDARAYQLGDDAWSLVLPLGYAQLPSVNAYLLDTPAGLTLIDCGSAQDPGWDALAHAIRLAGHAPAAITRLICTHLHQDHAGLADLVNARTGCELARGAGPPTAHDCFRDRALDLDSRRRRARREGVPEAELSMLIGPIIADDGRHPRAGFHRLLTDGESLGHWTVVSVPGHSAAQIALFDAERRWLISADLAGETPMLEFGSTPNPVAQHLHSLARALALGAVRMLPGHGRPIEPAAAVQATLQAAERRLRDWLALADELIAREGSVTGFALSERLDPGNRDLEWRQSSLSTALCLLEARVADGAATAHLGSDGVRRFTRGR